MNNDQIDDLIWGEFKSKIMEINIPLHEIRSIIKSIAMNGAYALFNGFLIFTMHKLGYTIKLDNDLSVNLDDDSWWVENLDNPKFMQLEFDYSDQDPSVPPFIFMQFVNDIGKDVTIHLLLNWNDFYESGLALVKSKLNNKTQSVNEIINEFHWTGSYNPQILQYLEALRDKDFGAMHKLVLRPDTLADYLIDLDDTLSALSDMPNVIITKQQWSAMSTIEGVFTFGKKEIIFCNEGNFKQLLKNADIVVPNVDFMGFNEFLKDKLGLATKEWAGIRDKYIDQIEKALKFGSTISDKHDFQKSKKYIRQARDALEKKEINLPVLESANAVEAALQEWLKNSQPLGINANHVKKYRKLSHHYPKLECIRTTRNLVAHPSEAVFTYSDAESIVDMADEFLHDLMNMLD